jgi:hypothetical protein
MGIENMAKIVIRPKRYQMEQYIDNLICDFVYYDASVDSLGKIRNAIRTAEFMGYPVHDYYSIWDELSGHLADYQGLQTEVLKHRNL